MYHNSSSEPGSERPCKFRECLLDGLRSRGVRADGLPASQERVIYSERPRVFSRLAPDWRDRGTDLQLHRVRTSGLRIGLGLRYDSPVSEPSAHLPTERAHGAFTGDITTPSRFSSSPRGWGRMRSSPWALLVGGGGSDI